MRMNPKFASLAKLVLAGVLLAPLCVARATIRADSISPKFPYGNNAKVRGVNIGGWLVAEPWITPGLFDSTGDDRIIDEWTFGHYGDPILAPMMLQTHWDTFYTEADFTAIAAAGLNHVRIPVGYWAFEVGDGEPYIQGALPYLQRAIGWAADNGLNVIIDLHGAPGSQNGYDHSGHTLPAPEWQMGDNEGRTVQVLQTIASMFASNGSVAAIEPINEPLGYYSDDVLHTLEEYYADAYTTIRNADASTVVFVHDAFETATYWNSADSTFLYPNDEASRENPTIIFDTHQYQIFHDEQLRLDTDGHVQAACDLIESLKEYPAGGVIVGEFSPVTTDCAKYLNGRGNGARYDGTLASDKETYANPIGSCIGKSGSATTFSPDYKATLRKYWEAQVEAYESGGLGWIQWTWKTEPGVGEEWSYSAGLANGWIPMDPTERQYPRLCN